MTRITPIVVIALLSACETSGSDGSINLDQDGDGFTAAGGDCDDTLPAINPAETDIAGDGVDQNCDGVDGTDADGDGVASTVSGGDDCDDNDASRWPGRDEELDDGVDQDCDELDDVRETFTYEGTIETDLLFVLDNSCSMAEEQGKLVEALPQLLDELDARDLEWHIGAVTTDMEDLGHRGKLVFDPFTEERWVTWERADPVAPLSRIFSVGTWGSPDESGRAAAYAAAHERRDTDNAGFFRDNAHLATIVMSDENDYSGDTPIALTDFIAWYEALNPVGGASFHALIGPTSPCPNSWEHGQEYADVVNAIGGAEASICEDDFGPFLEAMADHLVGATPIVLASEPVAGSIRVFVTPMGGSRVEWTEWSYDAETRHVVFSERPELDSAVEVLYSVALGG